jgi:hypothetical protein
MYIMDAWSCIMQEVCWERKQLTWPITYYTPAAGVEGQLRVLTSYKAAASVQDWPLAWASCPLLEPEQQLPAVLSMPLGFRSPPAFARVLAHVQQVRLHPCYMVRHAVPVLSSPLAASMSCQHNLWDLVPSLIPPRHDHRHSRVSCCRHCHRLLMRVVPTCCVQRARLCPPTWLLPPWHCCNTCTRRGCRQGRQRPCGLPPPGCLCQGLVLGGW